jgi:hypothetical protein
LAAVFMLGCAPRPPSVANVSSEPVTFVKLPPKVGRISVENNSIELYLNGEAKAGGRGSSEFRSHTVERERKRDEVLAVFDRIVTKKKVTYEKIEREESRNGASVAQRSSPLVGRSYIAELRQSVPIFTSSNGAPISDDEQRELSGRLANLGKPDPFLEGIPDGPIYPGRSAPGIGGGILELFEQRHQETGYPGDAPPPSDAPKETDVGKVDVHFAGVRDAPQGRCGVFAFELKIQMAGEPRLQMDLQGEFLVRVSDSAPIELDIRGPVGLSGVETLEGVNVELRGDGTMHGTFSLTYL